MENDEEIGTVDEGGKGQEDGNKENDGVSNLFKAYSYLM